MGKIQYVCKIIIAYCFLMLWCLQADNFNAIICLSQLIFCQLSNVLVLYRQKLSAKIIAESDLSDTNFVRQKDLGSVSRWGVYDVWLHIKSSKQYIDSIVCKFLQTLEKLIDN